MPYYKSYKKTALILPILAVWIIFMASGCGRGDTELFTLEESAVSAEAAAEEGLTAAERQPEAAQDGGAGLIPDADAGNEAVSFHVIHICGAVMQPGVYELPEGSRVMDAVRAGGGFTEDAAADSCNLAARIADGSRIYIMTEEEMSRLSSGDDIQYGMAVTPDAVQPDRPGGMDTGSTNAKASDGGRVNINRADMEQLKTLPGIGDSRAAAVIAYREAHGSFTAIEDIMKVSGIKQSAFARIKDRITV